MNERFLSVKLWVVLTVLLVHAGISVVSGAGIFPSVLPSVPEDDAMEELLERVLVPAAEETIVWSAKSSRQSRTVSVTDHGRVVIAVPNGSVSLMLSGINRAGAPPAAGRATIRTDAGSIGILRPGYSEWYLCDETTIEQGMEIAERPDVPGPLTVSYAIGGDLTPDLCDGSLVFSDTYGPVLYYGAPVARDAQGRTLPAELGLFPGTLVWKIDDSAAVYPISVDPYIVSQAADLAAPSPVNNGRYGISVALDDDILFIGEEGATSGGFQYAGQVHVYRNTDGAWEPVDILAPPDPAFLLRFGSSVAVHHTTAAIGANLADPAGISDAGAVYVYRYSGGSWNPAATLTASDPSPGAGFGTSVAVHEETIVVGAPRAVLSGKAMGQVYVFQPDGDTWSQVANITSPDETGSVYFGNAVSLSGDTVVIGAYQAESGSAISAPGKAYIFRNSGGSWERTANLTAWTNRSAGSRFGSAVSIDNDTVVVGALFADIGVLTNAGQAYIFRYNGGTWSGSATLIAPDKSANAYFGSSVFLDNGTVVVGAYNARKAYAFRNSGGSWVKTVTINATDLSASSGFGGSVALHDTTAAIGASLASAGGVTLAGRAYVFALGETPPAPSLVAISPPGGTNTSDVIITDLAGMNFNTTSAGTQIRLERDGCPDITATGITVESPEKITCVLPITGAAAGTWDLVIVNPDGQAATGAGFFTIAEGIPAPAPSGIEPSAGFNTGPIPVTITGMNFNTTPGGTAVSLTRPGETPITVSGITPASAAAIDLLLPAAGAAPGIWTVTVTNPDGQEGTVPGGFSITSPAAAPSVTGITPAAAVSGESIAIIDLAGANFDPATPGTVVMLNRTGSGETITAGDIDVVSSEKITCTFDLAGAAAGNWSVVVVNPDGQQGMAEDLFAIVPPDPTTEPTADPTADPTAGPTTTPAPQAEPYDDAADSGTGVITGTAAMLPEIRRGSTGTFRFPAAISREFPLAVTQVDIVPARDLSETTVVITRSRGGSDGADGLPTAGYVRIEIPGVSPDAVRQGAITFILESSWLVDHRLDPHDVVMLVRCDSSWEELATTYENGFENSLRFRAVTAGFSDFAVRARSPAPAVTLSEKGEVAESAPGALEDAEKKVGWIPEATDVPGIEALDPPSPDPAPGTGNEQPASSPFPRYAAIFLVLCPIAGVIGWLVIRR